MNQYQQVIESVGRVLESYDTDKRFPVFGFGARVRMPDGQWSVVQHCFPAYGGGMEVCGVDGIQRVGYNNLSHFQPNFFWNKNYVFVCE